MAQIPADDEASCSCSKSQSATLQRRAPERCALSQPFPSRRKPQMAQISADDEASCSCSCSKPGSGSITMTSTASLSTSTRLSDAWSAVTPLSVPARSLLRSVSVHPSKSSANLLRNAATSREQSTGQSTPWRFDSASLGRTMISVLHCARSNRSAAYP